MVKAQHLVVDSGGFLKNANIQSMGEKIYSIREVVTEIRDKATRQRLSFLPYEINFKQPTPESIQKIVDASKRTGDYPSLSLVDVKVLAMTYELTKQNSPESIQEIGDDAKGEIQFGGSNDMNGNLPGFYVPSQDSEIDTEEEFQNDPEEGDPNETTDDSNTPMEEENDVDEDEGWITPDNIQKIQQDERGDSDLNVQVACITTDFAMQNVLLKMGLNVFSVDGMLIKTVRSYVLRCHACFFITKLMTKKFCPKCGNNTLKRVPVEIKPDGSVKYFLSRNPKVLSKRGKKVSLPMPKGGKHAINPILCEDQPIPQNRLSKKAMQKTNVWSDEYAIDGNPFALNETESRSFKLGLRQGNRSGGRRGNPNAVNRKFVKRR
ncbi:RNA-binding protein NOB1-like [Styela clava]